MSDQNPSFGDDEAFGWEISRIDQVPPRSEPQLRSASEPLGAEPTEQAAVSPEDQPDSFKTPALFVAGLVIAFGASYLISNAASSSESTTEAVIQPAGASENSASSSDSNTGLNSDADNSQENQAALVITSDSLKQAETQDAREIPSALLESVEPTEENPTGAVRYALYRNGRAYLRGFARDDEAVDRLVSSFGSVFGLNNVTSEYELNPRAPRWTEAPIYFSDAVLFDIDSAEIRPGFYPLLERTARLIELGPFVTIRVVAMTDASGSADYNRDLAQRRANSVVDFYVEELGIDEIRFEADVLGEDRATQSADTQTAANERRVELIVSGIRG